MTTAQRRPAVPPPGTRHPASKVPEVTAFFWITKVLTTGMGESTSDFLVHRIDPVIAVGLGAVGLSVALVLQFARRTYSTWIYWLAVVMVAIFGTMAADVLHIRFHIPYTVTSTFFAITLAVIFVAWYMSERTLSIHSIYTRRREVFYWATVMATFALGTAVGDLTAYTLGLGYFTSAVVFAVVITIPGIAYRWLGLNAIAAFWSAYVVTRPLGASLSDWASVPHWRGGLAFGWGPVSVVLTVIIIGFVGYLAVSGKDTALRAPAELGQGRQRRGGRLYDEESFAGRPYPEPSYSEPSYSEPSYSERSYPEPPHSDGSYPEPSYSGQSYPAYSEPTYSEPPYPEPTYREPVHPDRSHPQRPRTGWSYAEQPHAGQTQSIPEYYSAPPAYPPSAPPRPRQPASAWERDGAGPPPGAWQPAGPWPAAETGPPPEAAPWSEARPPAGAQPPADSWSSPGARPRYGAERRADGQPPPEHGERRPAPPPGRPARGGRHRAPRS
ncbi:MAG TPA: hypothetical protein VIX86_26830 [Streptosporangiaceae bacterium]